MKVKLKFSDFVKGCNCKAELQLNYHVVLHIMISLMSLKLWAIWPSPFLFCSKTSQGNWLSCQSSLLAMSFTMTCLAVLVNIADVNADLNATSQTSGFSHHGLMWAFWNLAPFKSWNDTYCFFLIYFSIMLTLNLLSFQSMI